MIKDTSILFALFFTFFLGHAQILPNRYQEEIFTNYTETNEVKFSTNVPTPNYGGGFYEWLSGYPINVNEFDTYDQDLFMDIFEPMGDSITKRPVIIICFGGGFVAGSKDYWSTRELAIKLAKRGYVTATIDYRLGMNIFDQDLSKRAPYRGLQDGRSAIRFFKADANGANNYKIDTSNIYIGGHSAGAFIALHNAYLDKESERPLSTYAWTQDGNPVDDQLCMDCVGDNLSYTGNAKAVFSLAGALGDTLYVESASDPKVVMFHSSDDDTVDIDSGEPFGSLLSLVIGDDLPVVFGSQSISQRADQVNLDHIFNAYTDRGHNVHEETSTTLYDDIIPTISDSFFVNFLKPVHHPILGDSTVCKNNESYDYYTIADEAMYYDWEIFGGIIETIDIFSNTIKVTWDTSSTVHKIYLTPYSCTGARGNIDSLTIEMEEIKTNTWLGDDGSWMLSDEWSLEHFPTECEKVVYPDQDDIINVFLPQNQNVKIQSIFVGNKVLFSVEQNSFLQTTQKN